MYGVSIMGDVFVLGVDEFMPLTYKNNTKFMISVLLNTNKSIFDYPVFLSVGFGIIIK